MQWPITLMEAYAGIMLPVLWVLPM